MFGELRCEYNSFPQPWEPGTGDFVPLEIPISYSLPEEHTTYDRTSTTPITCAQIQTMYPGLTLYFGDDGHCTDGDSYSYYGFIGQDAKPTVHGFVQKWGCDAQDLCLWSKWEISYDNPN